MNVDLMAIMKRLNLPVEAIIGETFPGASVEVATASDWVRNPDAVCGYLLQRCCPAGMPQDQRPNVEAAVRALADVICRQIGHAERMLALSTTLQYAERCIRPNASAGLFATDAGGTATPGVVYNLRPRQKGKLQDKDLLFKSAWMLVRIIVDRVDCTRGWSMVGDQSFGFQEDDFKPYLSDTPWTQFREDVEQACTPLASLFNRAPRQDTAFLAQAVLDNTDEQAMLGITLQYYNSSCLGQMAKFRTRLMDVDFRQLTSLVGQYVCGCSGAQAPVQGFPIPFVPPQPQQIPAGIPVAAFFR